MGLDDLTLEEVDTGGPAVALLYREFIREADGPLGDAVDLEAEIAAGPPADLVPPNGAFLLARVAGEPAAIGGIRFLDAEFAEVKSMFVSPAFRGYGLGRRILEALHGIAAERGCRGVRLDTSAYLTEALALYRAAGYREVPAYNENPKADRWFERQL